MDIVGALLQIPGSNAEAAPDSFFGSTAAVSGFCVCDVEVFADLRCMQTGRRTERQTDGQTARQNELHTHTLILSSFFFQIQSGSNDRMCFVLRSTPTMRVAWDDGHGNFLISLGAVDMSRSKTQDHRRHSAIQLGRSLSSLEIKVLVNPCTLWIIHQALTYFASMSPAVHRCWFI